MQPTCGSILLYTHQSLQMKVARCPSAVTDDYIASDWLMFRSFSKINNMVLNEGEIEVEAVQWCV